MCFSGDNYDDGKISRIIYIIQNIKMCVLSCDAFMSRDKCCFRPISDKIPPTTMKLSNLRILTSAIFCRTSFNSHPSLAKLSIIFNPSNWLCDRIGSKAFSLDFVFNTARLNVMHDIRDVISNKLCFQSCLLTRYFFFI